MAAGSVSQPRRIEASRAWKLGDAGELWRYRDLLWFFTLRNIQVRYKQAVFGALWAVIRPFTAMVVLNLFFGVWLGLAQRVDTGIPYPVFLFAGLLPWTFFSESVRGAGESLVLNADLVRKIYFPRIVVPLASLGVPLLDFAISVVILLAMMVWYGVAISVSVLWIPALLVSMLLTVIGVGTLLSALAVSFRDFKYVIPFMIQIWFYATPVIYPLSALPEGGQWLASLNPVAGPIAAFRAVLLGTPLDTASWLLSTFVGLTLTIAGLLWFHRVERRFADVV